MSGSRKTGKQSTRSGTVALKASKLATVLGNSSPAPLGADTGELDNAVSISTDETQPNDTTDQNSRKEALRAEIDLLRQQLRTKLAEYRLLAGMGRKADSETVAKTVAMLSEEGGVTKARLIAETGAK